MVYKKASFFLEEGPFLQFMDELIAQERVLTGYVRLKELQVLVALLR